MSKINVKDENNLTNDYILSSFNALKEENHQALTHYHSINKYLLMSYDPQRLKHLGRLIAEGKRLAYDELYHSYEKILKALVVNGSSKPRRVNTFEHIYGYFKDSLPQEEKEQFFHILNDYIEDKTDERHILSVLKGYVDFYKEPYLATQTIFDMFE